MSADLPKIVAAAMERARAAGFEFGCEVEVGRVLAVLAGAVPDGGRIGELGTGVGVGTAWLVHGLGVRTDVEVVTIESDAATAAVAGSAAWPEFVRLIEGDALEHLEPNGPYDLLFPDAPGSFGGSSGVSLRFGLVGCCSSTTSTWPTLPHRSRDNCAALAKPRCRTRSSCPPASTSAAGWS